MYSERLAQQGLSVPDSDMLISILEVLEVPVSILLGENVKAYKINKKSGQG